MILKSCVNTESGRGTKFAGLPIIRRRWGSRKYRCRNSSCSTQKANFGNCITSGKLIVTSVTVPREKYFEQISKSWPLHNTIAMAHITTFRTCKLNMLERMSLKRQFDQRTAKRKAQSGECYVTGTDSLVQFRPVAIRQSLGFRFPSARRA